MTKQAKGTYTMDGWDEKTWDGKPYNEVKGAKLTHAIAKFTYKGDLEGEGTTHYLMNYRDDGTADFVGLQQIKGKLGGKSGSFVLQITGSFANQEAKSTWAVVPGSGTGDLKGLEGNAENVATHGDNPYSLNYDLK